MIRQLHSYRQLGGSWMRRPWSQRLLLLEAALALLIARLLVSFVPFGRLAPWLGRRDELAPAVFAAGCEARAQQTGQAIQTMSRHLPWQCTCLVQAIAAMLMLRRRGLASTLYLGLARGSNRQLEAHAWLQCGALVITGAEGRNRFTVISTFPPVGGKA